MTYRVMIPTAPTMLGGGVQLDNFREQAPVLPGLADVWERFPGCRLMWPDGFGIPVLREDGTLLAYLI